MGPSMANLPYLVLDRIFSNLPMLQMFNCIDLVCRNWNRVQASIINCRKELVLYGDLEDLDWRRENFHSHHFTSIDEDELDSLELVFENGILSDPFQCFLMEMQNLTTLVVNIDFYRQSRKHQASLGHFLLRIALIVQLRQKTLQSLEFRIDCELIQDHVDEVTESTHILVETINECPSLKCLTLLMPFLGKLKLDNCPLTILSSLDILVIENLNRGDWISDNLLSYASPELTIHHQGPLQLSTFEGLNYHLTCKFSSLKMIGLVDKYNRMLRLANRLPNITRLDLQTGRLTFAHVMTQLRFLSRLHTLCLDFSEVNSTFHAPNRLDDLQRQLELGAPPLDPTKAIPQQSVRRLFIKFSMHSHEDAHLYPVSTYVPNVEEVCFLIEPCQCPVCAIPLGWYHQPYPKIHLSTKCSIILRDLLKTKINPKVNVSFTECYTTMETYDD